MIFEIWPNIYFQSIFYTGPNIKCLSKVYVKKTLIRFEINMDDSKPINSLPMFYIILFLCYCKYLFLFSIYGQSFKKLLPLSQIHINYMTHVKRNAIFIIKYYKYGWSLLGT